MIMAIEKISIEPIGNEFLITRTRTYREWFGFGKERSFVEKFRGDCTVWRRYPSGVRCSTPLESWLCDVWTREQWRAEGRK